MAQNRPLPPKSLRPADICTFTTASSGIVFAETTFGDTPVLVPPRHIIYGDFQDWKNIHVEVAINPSTDPACDIFFSVGEDKAACARIPSSFDTDTVATVMEETLRCMCYFLQCRNWRFLRMFAVRPEDFVGGEGSTDTKSYDIVRKSLHDYKLNYYDADPRLQLETISLDPRPHGEHVSVMLLGRSKKSNQERATIPYFVTRDPSSKVFVGYSEL